MQIIRITGIELGTYKEINFKYKGLNFVYKYISTDGWNDGTLIDLNNDQLKLTSSDFQKLQEIINDLDIDNLEAGDEIDAE